MRKSSKIFFGWWTVLACSVVGFLGVGVAGSGLSVLFKPIAADLGLSRATASMAASAQSLGQGVSGLTAGRVTDRYGPRLTICTGILLMVLGLVLMFFVRSLWSFLCAWGVFIGIGYSFGATFVTDTAIVRWFVRRSGTAINIKFAIQSLYGLALIPAMAWFTTANGWRYTCITAAALIAVVCLPLTWFLIRPHPPEKYGLLPDGARPSKEGASVPVAVGRREHDFQPEDLTLKQTLTTSSYWLLIALAYLSGAAGPIMTVHCIPFLTDMGIDPVKAAAIMSIILTSSIPSRLVTGWVLDRVKTVNLRFILAMGFLAQAIGVLVFLATRSTNGIYVWFSFFGIGSGVTQSVQVPLWARYFGRKYYGSILGSSMAMSVPLAVAAPVYIGWIYDRTGTYIGVITAFMALLALASAVSFFVMPPKATAGAARAAASSTTVGAN